MRFRPPRSVALRWVGSGSGGSGGAQWQGGAGAGGGGGASALPPPPVGGAFAAVRASRSNSSSQQFFGGSDSQGSPSPSGSVRSSIEGPFSGPSGAGPPGPGPGPGRSSTAELARRSLPAPVGRAWEASPPDEPPSPHRRSPSHGRGSPRAARSSPRAPHGSSSDALHRVARAGSGAGGSSSGGGGSGGGASSGARSGGGVASPASAASAAATASAAAEADAVSSLPLGEQVLHYARETVAAAEVGNAMRSAMAQHLLNGCFMRANGFEAAAALAEAAVGGCPGLVGCLVEAVAEGAPQSLAAFNALTYLAVAPQVVPHLLSGGLVPVLVGQLRAAASSALEQQLLASGLGLLATMARVDGEARAAIAGSRGLAGALAGALLGGAGGGGGGGGGGAGGSPGSGGGSGGSGAAIRGPALSLLAEVVMVRKGLNQVCSSDALMTALDCLCDEPLPGAGPGAGVGSPQQGPSAAQRGSPRSGAAGQSQAAALQRRARQLRATIAVLAAVMA
ncbi:hypothetical protein HYH03_009562 [Edaphochlamys debaryana]|uniref:Uncharacterized protein n=1 Tax=Edaphochlamys debaryana TaxID=47281 RepID=A0A835Y6T9_9CHLO|nr:hypothetical protein HYH03_009562 [Edaphochlamys debaryana]|eukprot:KAG2492064.1 hypothetical protein HYH03_009562 [Edaphochlamys debaryana]